MTPAAADDARQREGHPKPRLQTANWDHGVLIVEHHFGNAGRYDANAVLAGVMAFDNCDVGITNFLFYLVRAVRRLFRRAFSKASTTKTPPMRAEDHRKTCEVP